MALTNSQYDSLLREYTQKQNDNRYMQLERKKEIQNKIPSYKELEDQISSIAIEQAKCRLYGDSNGKKDLHEEIAKLSAQKRELLISHGYPEDYLELHYSCPDCRDTGYIGNTNEKCHCLKKKMIALLYDQSNIANVLEKENFSTLSEEFYSGEDLDRFKNAVAVCHKFVEYFDSESRNLFLFGSVGVGKTFLSNCIAKEIIETGHFVLYFTISGLIDVFSQNTFGRNDENILAHSLDDIYNCDLLVIDDLGTELTNAFVITQLFSCLNERYLRNKSTIISTNLSLTDLRERYSERIFSRITSHYDMLKITGSDIRMMMKTRNLESEAFHV